MLTDITPPFIAGAERSNDTEIILEFSEGVIGLSDADPADFIVVETGSDGSVTYEVTAIGPGADDRHAVLTVESMAASGKEGVTLIYTPGSGATIRDPAGFALEATDSDGIEIDPWDTEEPGIASVTRVDDVTLTVTFTEAVEAFDRADDAGFSVTETGDPSIGYAVKAARTSADGLSATLTVDGLGPSAKEGITVTYTAGGNGTIADIAGNPLASTATGLTIDPWDLDAPTIVSGSIGPGNAYVDVTFSEGVYGGKDGSGAVTEDDFKLTLAPNGGHAKSVEIVAVRKADGATPDEASPLVGGERTVRLFIETDKPASGSETVSVAAADATAIFDRAGHAVGASQTTGALDLEDVLPPEIVSISRSGNTMLIVTLSEDVTGLAQANDGGFTVEETDSEGQIAYPVVTTARGVNDRQIVLTVARDFAVSAREGLTVRYTASGNGRIADLAGNPLASTDEGGFFVDPWDTDAPEIDYGPLLDRDLEGRYYIVFNMLEGIFGSDDGTTGVTADHFELVLDVPEDGLAEGVNILGLEAMDEFDWVFLGAPTGGETRFAIYFEVVGLANGLETLYLKPKDGESIFDLAGNPMPDEPFGFPAMLFNMTEPSEIVEAELVDATTILVTMSEDVVIWDDLGERIGFTVEEIGSDGAITYTVTAVSQLDPEDTIHLVLTVDDMSLSAKEGVLLRYEAGDLLAITDFDYNEIKATTVEIDPWDTDAPTITKSEWEADASYVDITFSEPVYSKDDGTGALTVDDFDIEFEANDGTATGVTVLAVRAADGDMPETASELVGGETKVRVFLSVEGTPTGVETISVTPADGASIFDLAGNAITADQSTAIKTLPDQRPPVTFRPVTEPASQDFKIIVNGEVQEAMATSTVDAVDGRQQTTVSLDEQKLDERLADEEEAPTITVPILNGSDAVKVELNGRMVQSLGMRHATVEVETEGAAYSIPAELIDIVIVAEQLGATQLEDILVYVEMIQVPAQESTGQDAATIAHVAPVIEFRITAVYGDRTVEIDGFTAYVERSITIPQGVDRGRITTGVWIGPNGEWFHVPTRIVERNGSYEAIINSLTNSAYTVIDNERTFADLAEHWAKASVEDMASRLIVKGAPNGLFEPDRAVTRAEFAAMTVRALGLDGLETNEPLAREVRPDDWFAGAVATAKRYGLVKGGSDGLFRPKDTITRQEAMVIMARAAKLAGLAGPEDPHSVLAPFADAADVAAWAREGAALVTDSGIIRGAYGLLAPHRELTKAEAAVMLQRLLQTANLINS